MKTSIVKIDYMALDKGIFEYQEENGFPPSYIVMSTDTAKLMRDDNKHVVPHCDICSGRVDGIKIAINDTLPFGQVDIV